MENQLKSHKEPEIKNLSCAETARLAGVIWIYGGIFISGDYPRINITVPIPIVYEFQEDFGGKAYREKDGYFTLQISGKELVKKRLKEIQSFMGGEESEQIRLALEICRINDSTLSPTEKTEKREKLKEEFNESVNKLKNWMKEFVKKNKNKPISDKPMPSSLWKAAYNWSEFMNKSGYEKFPRMFKLEKN